MHLAQGAALGGGDWVERLLDYYEGVLREGRALPAGGGLGEAAAISPGGIPSDVYATVLTGAAGVDGAARGGG